jgi:hypothetical protein
MIFLSKCIVAGFIGCAAFLVAERPRLLASGSWMASAEARIGRPMTPMSYAGVARRTTRRSVAVGAGGAAAYGASGYYAPGCTQVVDAYGAVYYRCP